jgi:hypothetical protein
MFIENLYIPNQYEQQGEQDADGYLGDGDVFAEWFEICHTGYDSKNSPCRILEGDVYSPCRILEGDVYLFVNNIIAYGVLVGEVVEWESGENGLGKYNLSQG